MVRAFEEENDFFNFVFLENFVFVFLCIFVFCIFAFLYS